MLRCSAVLGSAVPAVGFPEGRVTPGGTRWDCARPGIAAAAGRRAVPVGNETVFRVRGEEWNAGAAGGAPRRGTCERCGAEDDGAAKVKRESRSGVPGRRESGPEPPVRKACGRERAPLPSEAGTPIRGESPCGDTGRGATAASVAACWPLSFGRSLRRPQAGWVRPMGRSTLPAVSGFEGHLRTNPARPGCGCAPAAPPPSSAAAPPRSAS